MHRDGFSCGLVECVAYGSFRMAEVHGTDAFVKMPRAPRISTGPQDEASGGKFGHVFDGIRVACVRFCSVCLCSVLDSEKDQKKESKEPRIWTLRPVGHLKAYRKIGEDQPDDFGYISDVFFDDASRFDDRSPADSALGRTRIPLLRERSGCNRGRSDRSTNTTAPRFPTTQGRNSIHSSPRAARPRLRFRRSGPLTFQQTASPIGCTKRVVVRPHVLKFGSPSSALSRCRH